MSNNAVTLVTNVVKRANLGVAVRPSDPRPVPRRAGVPPLVLTLLVINNGPNPTDTVVAKMDVNQPNLPLSIVTLKTVTAGVTCVVGPDQPITMTCTKPTMNFGESFRADLEVDLDFAHTQAFNVSATVDGAVTDIDFSDNNFVGAWVTPISNTDAELQVNFDPSYTPIGYQPGWFKGAKASMGMVVLNNGPVTAQGANFTWITDSNLLFQPLDIGITRPSGANGDDACARVCPAAGTDAGFALSQSFTPSAALSSTCAITCTFGEIVKGEFITINIAGRIDNSTTTQFAHQWVATVASTNPDPKPNNNVASHQTWIKVQNQTTEVGTYVPPVQEVVVVPVDTGTAFLTYLLMILIPLIILIIATCVAWKLGFFKRKRPPKDGEEAPGGGGEIENAFGGGGEMETVS